MTQSKQLPRLRFKKNIVPSVEESIPTKELLSRLKDLSNELSSIDQDKIDISSLDTVKDMLISKKLMRNNNMAVQSYVSCCLSDILRIYAPDAPFTATQLSDLFKLFFNQFKHLNEQDNGNFSQYYYLLSKLAEVRSIILVTDLPDSDKLIENCFDVFYGLANQPNFPMKLETLICDILSEVISESDTVPTKVLKLILNKFLNDKNVANTVNPSLNFTLSICNTNTDRISRLITQFFSELIYDGNQDNVHSHEFLENLNKLHKLSIQIWKYIPELLLSVMGLIEDELETDDVTIRLMATETVSKIISIHPSQVNFMQVHSDTYTAWLKKTLDVSVLVRCKWVETTLPILLSNRSDLSDIINGLTKGLLDNDEKVRFITCKILAELPPRVFLDRIASETIMSSLSQLIREKHSEIRLEIIKLLGNLYNDCWEEFENKLLKWIPDQILNLNYINDKSIILLVDLCLLERIIPFENSLQKRVHRLLAVINQLSTKAKSSFYAILKRQQQISKVVLQFLELCELYNGGNVMDGNTEPELFRKLDKITDWLSMSLPSFYNSKLCLQRFIKLNNRRFYRLIRICISADSDYDTMKNSMKELFNKLNDLKNLKIDDDITIPASDMLKVFKILLYRSSLIIANKSNIPEITESANDMASPYHDTAMELLESISQNVPGVFKSHIHELTQYVMTDTARGQKLPTLKTIYHFLKQYKDFNESLDIEFYDKLFQISLNGSMQESKYSIKIICLSRHKYSYTEDILTKIYPLDLQHKDFTTHLSIIAEFYLEIPELLEDKSSEITSMLIKDVLLTNSQTDEDDEQWIKDELLEKGMYMNCEAKLMTLQIFTNRLLSLSTNDVEIENLANPVFKLFMSLIGNGGEVVKNSIPTPKNYQSKLRLFAGLKFLEIFQKPVYNKLLTPITMNRLVFLIQDECYEVRLEFVNQLQKLLNSESLGERFFPLLYFTAHEPDSTLQNNVKTWLKTSFNKHSIKYSKSLLFEKSLVRLLHMISHHLEYIELMNRFFETNDEDTLLQAYGFALEYICFYLKMIANEDNVSLLFYFSQRLKQYRDILISNDEYENSQTMMSSIYNIYRISELCQLTIEELTHHKGWTLSTYPGKFTLASDLYYPIKTQQEAQQTVQTIYIENIVQSKLRSLVKMKISGMGGKKRVEKRHFENKENIKVKKLKPVKQLKPLKSIVKPTMAIRKSERNFNKTVNYNDEIA